jgi:hypothetical protein
MSEFSTSQSTAALRARVPERVPRGHQLRELLVQLVSESAESAFAVQRPGQATARALIGDTLGEVSHIPIPDRGGQRIHDDQIQLVEIDRVLPIDAQLGGPEHGVAGSRVDQPPVFIVGLIGQRGGDLVQIEPIQIEHRSKIVHVIVPAGMPEAPDPG